MEPLSQSGNEKEKQNKENKECEHARKKHDLKDPQPIRKENFNSIRNLCLLCITFHTLFSFHVLVFLVAFVSTCFPAHFNRHDICSVNILKDRFPSNLCSTIHFHWRAINNHTKIERHRAISYY